MGEAGHPFLEQMLILLAAAVLAVALFRRLRLPAVLAYLFVGAAIGPHGLGLLSHGPNTDRLAEFGVVFLLFNVGLKFSLPQLVAMRAVVLGFGGAQVAITTAVFGLMGWWLGLAPGAAFIVGGTLAMSSTAMIGRLLGEQGELNARHGRTAVGILLFQDLAVLPFLIAIPVLAGETAGPGMGQALIAALGKGALVVLLMLAAGRWLLRPALQEVAASRSSELFTLATLLFALTAAGASYAAGLSMPLGAFLAGMMLGETEFRHQVEADIRPFQDVLLGLFFVTVGMLLDLGSLPATGALVLLVAAVLILFKLVLVTLLGRFADLSPHTALRTGLVLAQGGEFGLVMLSLALKEGVLTPAIAQPLLTAIVISMAVTPLLARHNGAIARKLMPEAYRRSHAQIVEGVTEFGALARGHVVICGYGRIGQSLARFLDKEGVPFLGLDLDPLRVREARAAGEPVVFGDAAHDEILAAAGVDRARALVVSFDDVDAAERVVAVTRRHSRTLPVLVRTRDDSQLERLQRAGSTEVVPETLEASLMLASHLLLILGIHAAVVAQHVQTVRRDRYRMMRGFFLGQEAIPLENTEPMRERLATVTLPAQAFAVGRRLRELKLRETGAMVTAIRRSGIRGPQPEPEMQLRAGDTLVLYGSPEELALAESALLRGS